MNAMIIQPDFTTISGPNGLAPYYAVRSFARIIKKTNLFWLTKRNSIKTFDYKLSGLLEYLWHSRCAYSHVDPPCTLEEDLSLEYPECCPKPVCPPAEDDEELDDNGNGNDLDLVVYDLEVPEQTKQVNKLWFSMFWRILFNGLFNILDTKGSFQANHLESRGRPNATALMTKLNIGRHFCIYNYSLKNHVPQWNFI